MQLREWKTCTRNFLQRRLENRSRPNMFVAAPRRKLISWWVSARAEGNNMAIPGFGEIAEQMRRSTVLIQSGRRASGSGVIWSNDGIVVTNAHVIQGSEVRVQLWDGREFEAA